MPTGNWWDRLHFGLFFGLGFCIAYGVLQLILLVLNHARPLINN